MRKSSSSDERERERQRTGTARTGHSKVQCLETARHGGDSSWAYYCSSGFCSCRSGKRRARLSVGVCALLDARAPKRARERELVVCRRTEGTHFHVIAFRSPHPAPCTTSTRLVAISGLRLAIDAKARREREREGRRELKIPRVDPRARIAARGTSVSWARSPRI